MKKMILNRTLDIEKQENLLDKAYVELDKKDMQYYIPKVSA
jgi:hypothetical protein